ncbi:MAG: RsmB/NOP family class I SAM-dependent RNA methyltransferase [archaeon]
MDLQPKELLERRMRKLITDYDSWIATSKKSSPSTIRCNTLKISPEKLKSKLEARGWKLSQPYNNKEIMRITSDLLPGELGKAEEHLLGYFYVQDISSMMPPLALNPKPNELILDLTAAPGSKTTQMSALMENSGTILANDKQMNRIKILASNLERCSCTNVIVTRHDAIQLCQKLAKLGVKFDKILLDLACSGEGTIRSSPKTFIMWNIKMISKLSRNQKRIASFAVPLLKDQGTLVYSTCTHAPEENEEVVNFLVKNFNLKVEKLNLPIKSRPGIVKWEGSSYSPELKNCARIYPQDNDTEGFFLAKMRKAEVSLK